ncbi:PEP-CTERM sorting domain-containing protein [Rubripirellula sp.]|nr:PEP-CTERM sorting domain-containing protein [Rubripirellula sp.]
MSLRLIASAFLAFSITGQMCLAGIVFVDNRAVTITGIVGSSVASQIWDITDTDNSAGNGYAGSLVWDNSNTALFVQSSSGTGIGQNLKIFATSGDVIELVETTDTVDAILSRDSGLFDTSGTAYTLYQGASTVVNDTDGTGYFGFSFNPATGGGGSTLYGWAFFDVTSALTLSITKWAYENSGNGIVVGDDGTGGGGTVPEPQSLAVMSLVGLGVLVRGRRRRS